MIDDAQTRETRELMPITVRIREACRLTGIGRSKLYELIAALWFARQKNNKIEPGWQ